VDCVCADCIIWRAPHEADVTTDLYVTSDPRLTTGSASAPMSAPGCSCRMLQRIQYALPLFIPSLLGRPHQMLNIQTIRPEPEWKFFEKRTGPS
jgi:hypothetical protein